MKPFFSIIIPVYNVEKYLQKCFNSVLEQSYKDYEVILIDDGSTDLSGRICDEISGKYSSVIVIHKENGGLSDARNTGMAIAKGEYIILLDSDDMIGNDGLKILSELIQRNNYPQIIINRIKTFREESSSYTECKYFFDYEINQLSIAEEYKKLMKNKAYIPGAWTIVSKREYLLENNLFFVKGLLHEDEQWTPRVILGASSMAYNNNCLYLYRVGREGSITYLKNVKREKDKLWSVNSLYTESMSEKYSLECKQALIERASDLYWGVLIRSFQYSNIREEYYDLIDSVNKYRFIFKLSKNKRYIICNLLINILGIEKVSTLLNTITERRKED